MRNVFFALIMLTTLDGRPVWVESTQVLVVRRSLDCAGQATTILVGGKPLCVKETVDEVREKIKKGNEQSSW